MMGQCNSGHIMRFYQGFWIRLQERGMRKRRLEELGVFGLFKGMLNILKCFVLIDLKNRRNLVL